MSAPTPREAALKVAVLEALVEAAKKEYAKARTDAEEVFAETGADHPQVMVRLPSGETVGRITIKDAAPHVTLPDGALLEWCREHFPAAVEEYVDPSAWESTDVIEAVRAKVPGVIRERVRPATAAKLVEEIEETGTLTDRRDGKECPVPGAEVSPGVLTGAFAFTDQKGPARRARIIAAWRSGELGGVGLGPLALPGPEAGEPQ